MSLPLPQAQLCHAHSLRRSQAGKPVEDGCTDLELRDLPIEVTGHHPLTQPLEAAHLGFHQAAAVVAAPFLPDGAPKLTGRSQDLVAGLCSRSGIGLRLRISANRSDHCCLPAGDGPVASFGVACHTCAH